MSDTTASLRRKISGAGDLQSVVCTMKAMAAASIGQYENAVRALDDYYRTVQLGLVAAFRQREPLNVVPRVTPKAAGAIGAVVFGSDQGLVGPFNEAMLDFVVKTLGHLRGGNAAGTGRDRPGLFVPQPPGCKGDLHPGESTSAAVGRRVAARSGDASLANGKFARGHE